MIEIDDTDEFPLKEGYTRCYTDHTGRDWVDLSPEEVEAIRNDPFQIEMKAILQEEIDKELIVKMVEAYEKNNV